MSLLFNSGADGIQRLTGTFPSGDFTAMGWVRNVSTAAPASDKLIWAMANQAYDKYFYVAIGAGGEGLYGYYANAIDADVNTGVLATLVLNDWHHWAVTYNATTHDIKFYVDGILGNTSNLNMSTAIFVQEFSGNDSSGSYTNNQDQAAQRLWTRVLTIVEILGEMSSRNAIIRTNLLRDTPIAALENLDDRSGNGLNWTAVGTPTTDVSPYVGQGFQMADPAAAEFGTGGGGSVTVTKPNGTVDGDILVGVLSHNAGTYATWPAGWTLIQRGLSNATRGEMYWKRASGEGASYTINGTGTAARAEIAAYHGGYKFASPVADSTVNTGLIGTKPTANALHCGGQKYLLVGGLASSANEGLSLWGQQISSNPELYEPSSLQLQFYGGGSTQYCAIYHLARLNAGNTQNYVASNNSSGDWVALFAAFIPAEAPTVTQTKYYLTGKAPNTTLLGTNDGTWVSGYGSPNNLGNIDHSYELSQNVIGSGDNASRITVSNRDTSTDAIIYRFVSPPLAAQTVSGNFNTLLRCISGKTASAPAPTAVLKVHAWLTVGNSLTKRATLLSNYVDSVVFNRADLGQSAKFQALTGAQALSSQAASSGDRIVVEIGVHVTNGAFPAPTRPPSEYVTAGFYVNAGGAFSNSAVGPAYADGVAAATTTAAGYITFSNPLIELDPDLGATNTTAATAVNITSLPYNSGPLKTTETQSFGRRLWWTWTANVTDRVHFVAWSTNYKVKLKVMDAPTNYVFSTAKKSAFDHHIFNSLSYNTLDVISGNTYYIMIESDGSTSGQNGNASAFGTGGSVNLQVFQKIALADNDVIIGAQDLIVRFTSAGQLADLMGDFAGSTILGLAIDYSGKVLTPISGGTHTAPRLLANLFPSGPIEIVDLATLSVGGPELDFISTGGALPASLKDISTLDVDLSGNIYSGYFGDGFLRVLTNLAGGTPSYLNATPSGVTGQLLLTSVLHGDNQPGHPFPDDPSIAVTFDLGGVNHVAISPDFKYIYYTSDGTYLGTDGTKIFRYNIATQATVQFATVTTSGHGSNPGLKGIFALGTNSTTNGGVLVCNGNKITQLDINGNLIKEFDPAAGSRSTSLIGVEVQSDGKAFWCIDLMSVSMFKFDIASSNLLVDIEPLLGSGTNYDLVIYRANTASGGGQGQEQEVIKQWFLQRFDIKQRSEGIS